MRIPSVSTAGLVAALAVTGAASVSHGALVSVTLQEGTHGEVITNKFLNLYGFSVSAVNIGGGPNKAIIFDSRQRNTADPDLEGYNQFTQSGPAWAVGNLKGLVDLGKMLILAENDIDANNDGLIDSPDDEGTRPAGRITLNFNKPITEFGFNLVDVEGPSEFNGNTGYVMTVKGVNFRNRGTSSQIGFGQFVTPGDPFYDPTITFGDRSANKIKPIQASQVGMISFNRVIIDLGGSGAIDQFRYTFIPEPASAALLAAPVLLAARRRRD